MSCQMNPFGSIVDLESVKKCLYVGGLTSGNLSSSASVQESKETKLEDAWSWSVDDSQKPVLHPNWLEECKMSLSPSGEIMALTHRQNLVILMAKWDSSEESTSKTKYHLLWHGDPCQEHNEVITSVCVLPLAPSQSQKSSSHSAPDWTCIALGFSSGALRFYTEKGDLLLSEVLEEGPVVSIKCQTMSAARYTGQAEPTEELHVLYHSVVCSIYGFVLSNTLRACRNQLARVQANCIDGIVAPPLSLQKWSLPDQDSLADAAVGLPQCPSAFSHLHIASVCGGYSAWYRPSPPQSSLVVAVGNKPFVGFHYIVEGSSAPVLTDVVKAVGTKLKSAFNQAVPSWFLGGRKPNPAPEKEKVVIEPAEPMVCRFGLCDLWRQGCTITMSPQRNLSVVTDTLGRVTLVDNLSGIALRMWKGYRDAQCGWLVAEEEQAQAQGRRRQALFLVIYAPKKGIVEVWAMQQGPRVATFTTSKHGRLFYIGHGLLGVSSLSSKNANRSSTPCFFVDEFGVLTDVTVPFHCALSDKNSKRAKDLHLVRKLRHLLKESTDAEQHADAVATLCRELQTNDVRAQALDLLASSRKVSANTLLEVVEGFLHWFETQDEDRPDASGKALMQRCVKLQKLLIFYLFCSGLQQKPPDYDTVVADSSNDFDNLCEFLRMSKQETQRILKFPEVQDKVRVKFQGGLEGLPGYLAGFKTDTTSDEVIDLVDPTACQDLIHISDVVCGCVDGNVSGWASAAADSGIAPSALLRLALTAWLHRRTRPTVGDTLTLGQLVSAICNIAGEKVQESGWWEGVRSLLKDSSHAHLAILAAAVCKAVAVTFEETAVMSASAGTDDSETKSSDWEKVTQESCTWSLLTSQLEDVALIASMLRHKPVCSKDPRLYCLPYEPPELSLQKLCSKGRGCVSELVARWVASSGLDPSLLLEGSRESSQSPDSSRSDRLGSGVGVVEGQPLSADTGQEAKPTSPEENTVLDRLAELRQQFPYSLADNVLLANITWEYVLAWTRQVDNLQCLQAAISCLKVIPDPHLRQGVCSLTWTMHVKGRFESTVRLVNKVGKVPKERLCRQDIGLSELQIADFFHICSEFFDIFLESRALSEESPKTRVKHEDLWPSSPVPPLQQLALDQPLANYDVLLLLSQCCRALHILASFSLRTQRPINAFFDSIGQSALFADINAHIQLPSHVVDAALTETRTQFLLRAVTAAMATITHHDGEYNMSVAVEWMKQCLLLAADWSISADPLRRQQCYELYARGYDRLAEEVIPSVNDSSELGSQLLVIAGHRLRLTMAESSSQLREQITHMSPTLSGWVASLAEATVEPTSLDDTLELVVVIASLVEEDSHCKRIATQLLDSLAPIVNRGNLGTGEVDKDKPEVVPSWTVNVIVNCSVPLCGTKDMEAVPKQTSIKFSLGDLVWINPIPQGEWDVPRAVKVLMLSGKQLKVVDNNDQISWVSTDTIIKTLHPTSINHVEDMITLGELEEYTILHNLHVRYKQNIIYTYIGMMLVAINPYQDLPLYGDDMINRYRGQPLGALPAHIYAIGSQGYSDMRRHNSNQCVVISGESGSGKTESTKLLMKFLTALSGQNSDIEQQLILANPVLEGFGNAKTVRNDNSSRFGKYVVISYNEGQIVGACVQVYLLEKSRVTNLEPGNRNYHVFYSLLAGLSDADRARLGLGRVGHYQCLTSGGSIENGSRNEVEEFKEICEALKVLKFSEEESWEVFKLLAVILHICNIKFQPSQVDNMDFVTIINTNEVEKLNNLLQVDKLLLNDTLTKKTLQVEGEKVVSGMSKSQALSLRDAFARALYYRLFIYIVDKINKTIFKHKSSNSRSIGILDIFGFEDFDNNSFEQLCINYANEQLQQFFVKHIFKLEQEEYKREQIKWTHIAFDDNEKILSLIGSDRANIFSTVDDLSRLPSGNDASLVMKLNKSHEKNPFYVKPKSDIAQVFGVRHYAGTVTYNVEGFLEKNRNTLSADWLALLRTSPCPLIRTLFAKDIAQGRTAMSHSRNQSVLSQYRSSLDALMSSLVQCRPYFIRCIKPNDFKQPNMFESSFCCRQLRQCGLMDTAKIRSMGYAIRLTYADFVHRYSILLPGKPPAFKVLNPREETEKICRAVLGPGEYQFGLTKVFLKQRENALLELERGRVLDKSVVVIQRHVRGWIVRRRYLKLKKAALLIQKNLRGYGPRRDYLVISKGYLRLQAVLRSRLLTHSFSKLRTRITRLQARCRGFLVRKVKKAQKREPSTEVDSGDIEQWITSIFEAAIEGSEDVNPPSDKISESPTKKVGFSLPSNRDRIPMRLSESEADDVTKEDLTFRHFAAANFRGNVTYQYSKQPLRQSLLDLPLPANQAAATALWVTILRFMGDLPEPQFARNATNTSVMSILTNTLSRSSTNSSDYAQAIRLLKKDGLTKEKGKITNLSLAHKNKLKKEITKAKLEGNTLKVNYSQWLDNTKTNILQKLHFIIGHGILWPELRDEIYCQICKQLTGNPSTGSQARGWALMALCVGCFSPSPRLAPTLRRFLELGPAPYNQFCKTRLQRTLQNGTRKQPPSWHELNAIRNQQSMTLAVNLSDGSTKYLEADSAITAEEICSQLADHLGMQDTFGFSLFVIVFVEMVWRVEQVMRLEAGRFHVMDAISQCEQDAKERGVAERDTPWQLVYRKEMFAPWQGLSIPDPVATNLIYRQVVKGIKSGEYRLIQDSELALIAAQQYYVDHGANLVAATLRQNLPEYIPQRNLRQSGLQHWESLVTDAFQQSYFLKGKVPEGMVKADVVTFAKNKWPLLFSKFYEATQISGPDIGAVNVILAVNSTGVCIVSSGERVLLQLSYIEIHSITLLQHHQPEKVLQLLTIHGYEFVFQSPQADVATDLVQWVISSLKQVSKYYIAVQDYSPPDSGGLLNMKRGDLIALEEGERGGEWLTGYNVLSGAWGEFPASSVRVLPTILQPPLHIVAYFNKEGALDGTLRARAIQRIMPVENKHNLEQYCKKYFRPPLGSEPLWSHSAQPLRLPLHKALQNHPQRDAAVNGYMGVLKYMGDLPVTKPTDLTEIIFQGPMEHEVLRDELYCQLMKQLTDNESEHSEERGWELMCLATGLFCPSTQLLKELRLFLSSREHALAYDSLKRLEQTLVHGNRKYPPHWTETQAMQQRVPIVHTICFPDQSEHKFEVNSTTRIGDLVQEIGDRLGLQTTEGFSLVVSVKDKTVALANEEFLFDAIQEICSWVTSDSSLSKEGQTQRFLYELMFMRKLWLSMVPGKDRVADVVCHYPQELPKYILGYQKCSKADAVELAALIFRAENGDGKLNLLDDSKKTLSTLLPPYHLKLQSAKMWQKTIAEAYKKQSGMTSEEAKINYLKFIFSWSTFGSAFFDVRQISEKRFPENVTLVINKNGIFVLDKQTKEPLTLYPFTELTSWSASKTSFTLLIGSVKLECITALGYKMDDLITSYTALILPRNNGV